MVPNATERFSDRVEKYVLYRPGYPEALFDLLVQKASLGPKCEIADIGSGTGISSRRLAGTGAKVYAVEPNAAMRKASEPLSPLGERGRGEGSLIVVDATAEATTLPDAFIDLVTAFQAFHWFDRAAARREFARILKPGGLVALAWNERIEDATPFLRGYEALLREFAGDYLAVRHNAISEPDLAAWFGGGMRTARFENAQAFDFDGILGRLMSSSYAPAEGDPRHAPMVAALRRLFDATQVDGRIEFLYETNAYYGPLGSSESEG